MRKTGFGERVFRSSEALPRKKFYDRYQGETELPSSPEEVVNHARCLGVASGCGLETGGGAIGFPKQRVASNFVILDTVFNSAS